MDQGILEKVNEVLLDIFPGKKITDIQLIPEISVNQLITFKIAGKKYLMKLLVRPPTAENEYYRLEKEAKLMKQFKHLHQTIGVAPKDAIAVPVPEIFFIESNEERLGYKFLIMEFIEGEILENIWSKISIEEKKALAIQFAHIIKGVHSIKYNMFGQIEDYDCPRQFFSFESLIKANVRRYARILGPKNILPISLITNAVKFVEDNLDKLTYKSEATLVHRDFSQSNFIVNKIDENKWSVKALLDFEWSYSGSPIIDLLDIPELLPEKEIQEIFYQTYFENKRSNLDEYIIEKKILTIHEALETIAIGWVNFHPSKENIQWIEKVLRETLNIQV
ncbi:MAG: phosphotransferase family protein [Candidatus Thorarchaeota archaeon]